MANTNLGDYADCTLDCMQSIFVYWGLRQRIARACLRCGRVVLPVDLPYCTVSLVLLGGISS